MSAFGAAIAGVSIGVVAFLLALTFTCSLCQGYRNSRDNAATHAALAALAARHPPEPPAAGYWDHDEEQEARRRRAREEHGPPPRASPTASMPSFTYKPSATTKHNVTGGGGEETCSVCLGAFQAGETVRLLPLCLHLYHVECIDMWLASHTTCPVCRSGIDSPVDVGLLPPV
ncbi:hypothetical protein PR202_gb27616 [Eleusine coracana subsp. coracana]|uniref:RING-type E3 ubiquitin transferase n=1 Tax=Eleusine coracana subsp. coracana TaxID=191504 RepID=A0AAV5FUC9_ELECO|nr:hypothetical protein QOZ80_6AG0542070 [Eleusine coracana subsp. coracana]GJN38561.1 hypothetical protein PR202_gb27616 [Eleusine coracana subsp. coracana]